LPSPSLLRNATSPKRERQRISQIQQVLTMGRNRLSLWESWREAPERVRTLTKKGRRL
jgi:hypothetical protein